MFTSLVSQNHFMRCVVHFGTPAIEVIGGCLNKLEQQAPLDRVSAESNTKRAKNDNVIIQNNDENPHRVTYETLLKELFFSNRKMTLMQMPMKIELKKKGYSYEEENTKIFSSLLKQLRI